MLFPAKTLCADLPRVLQTSASSSRSCESESHPLPGNAGISGATLNTSASASRCSTSQAKPPIDDSTFCPHVSSLLIADVLNFCLGASAVLLSFVAPLSYDYLTPLGESAFSCSAPADFLCRPSSFRSVILYFYLRRQNDPGCGCVRLRIVLPLPSAAGLLVVRGPLSILLFPLRLPVAFFHTTSPSTRRLLVLRFGRTSISFIVFYCSLLGASSSIIMTRNKIELFLA